MSSTTPPAAWPALPYDAWGKTCATLHLWLQIVGKVPLMQLPWIAHSWHIAFVVTARGLATRLMPHGTKAFQVEFDFLEHRLHVQVSDARRADLPLDPQSVAAFYRRFMETLQGLEVPVAIRPMPSELPDPIPFDRDETHRSYDAEYANRYWRALVQATRVFDRFRARFKGKCSSVHYFWGSADLAVTRFSGRPAPEHPGGKRAASVRGVLLIRLSRAGGLRAGERAPGRGALQRRAARVHPAVRSRRRLGIAGRHIIGVSAKHLRGCHRTEVELCSHRGNMR